MHLNPARARLLAPGEALRAYRWSSWPEYLKPPSRRWPWLRVGRLLGEYRLPRDSAVGRRRLEEALEARRGAAEGEAFQGVRRGWCLGGEQFRQELLAGVDRPAAANGQCGVSEQPVVSAAQRCAQVGENRT